MKKIVVNLVAILSLLLVISCQEKDKTFGDLTSPSNISVATDIVGKSADKPDGDGSGKVVFTAKADNAISYKFIFPDKTSVTNSSGVYEKQFTTPGVNEYAVTVIAIGKAGIFSNKLASVKVRSDFADDEAVQLLAGGSTEGSTKTWYFAANEKGHLGVGSNTFGSEEHVVYSPTYYAAPPFAKAGDPASSCLYENKLTFSIKDKTLQFVLDNGGATYFNNAFKSVGGGTNGGDDACLPFTPDPIGVVLLGPSASEIQKNYPGDITKSRGTEMTLPGNSFMGYYIKQTKYEILSITATRLAVRAVDGASGLAWYHIFTTTKPVQ